jgi:hypothetical protein
MIMGKYLFESEEQEYKNLLQEIFDLMPTYKESAKLVKAISYHAIKMAEDVDGDIDKLVDNALSAIRRV